MKELELLSEIKTKGYWNVVARPSKFDRERLDIEDCRMIVEKNQVSLRGWNYPHTHEQGEAYGGIRFGQDFAECSTDFQSNKELWRMYQSGQFFHAFACGEDYWGDTADQNVLSIFNTLYRISEIYLFLSGLARDNVFGNLMSLRVELHNMHDRRLAFVDDRFRRLNRVYSFSGEKLEFEREFKKTDIIEDYAEFSLDQCLDIIKRFGLINPDIKIILKQEQERFLAGTYGFGAMKMGIQNEPINFGIYRFREHDPFLNELVWKVRILHPDKRIHKCAVYLNHHALRLWDEADAYVRTIESGGGANFVIPNSIFDEKGKITVKSNKTIIQANAIRDIEITKP